jgi:hypothetical protein
MSAQRKLYDLNVICPYCECEICHSDEHFNTYVFDDGNPTPCEHLLLADGNWSRPRESAGYHYRSGHSLHWLHPFFTDLAATREGYARTCDLSVGWEIATQLDRANSRITVPYEVQHGGYDDDDLSVSVIAVFAQSPAKLLAQLISPKVSTIPARPTASDGQRQARPEGYP